MKKILSALFFTYAALMAVLCICGILKAIYELLTGHPVFAADWLLIEIPYVIVFFAWRCHMSNKPNNDPFYTAFNG